jgi:hypothetical protein
MRRKGQTVAACTTAAGIVVLVVAGFAARDRIREEWYLYQFERSEEATKIEVAERCGRAGLQQAVLWVFQEMRKDYETGRQNQARRSRFISGPPE